MDPSVDDALCSSVAADTLSVVEAEVKVKFSMATSFNSPAPYLTQEAGEMGSTSLQSAMIDGAIAKITSLPEEVLKVTTLQRHHNNQITALQAELQLNQDQKRKVEEKTQEVRTEIEHVKRGIYLLEADISQRSKRCLNLKTEIMGLVKESEGKRKALKASQLEVEMTKRQLEESCRKLDNLHDSITSAEETSRIMTGIKQTEERLAALQEKKQIMEQNAEETARICSGAAEKEVKKSIEELNKENEMFDGQVKKVEEEISAARSKQNQIKQAITVLQKRNAAQLIRLKRQVKEQQQRHRQWQEQVCMLQANVTTLTQKLNSS